jgi:hypothetical protein
LGQVVLVDFSQELRLEGLVETQELFLLAFRLQTQGRGQLQHLLAELLFHLVVEQVELRMVMVVELARSLELLDLEASIQVAVKEVVLVVVFLLFQLLLMVDQHLSILTIY